MPALAGHPRFGRSERLVVGEQVEPPPFQHVPEMAYAIAQHAGEELPVVIRVTGLGQVQLLGKENQLSSSMFSTHAPALAALLS